MNLPKLQIGDLVAKIPIIQGGMGVGVSRSRLAAAVANEGGVGIISGVGIGFSEPDFASNTFAANVRALKSEIKKARRLSPDGIIGVNFLVAMNDYAAMVRTAAEAGIDLIVSGAGLPTSLPELVSGLKTKIAPVISSGKAAKVISKYWDSHYNRAADLVIVEGPEAGGHLGFSKEDLSDDHKPSLSQIIRDVVEELKPFCEKYKKNIPVIAAGGIFSGQDIAGMIKTGANGVQMATRFVATEECDADIAYKNAYVNAEKEDIVLINSPVGMPGRALNNAFLKKIAQSGDDIKKCYRCLKGCNPTVAPYCISNALIHAVEGHINEGLIFVGSNAYRVNKIVTVRELISQLVAEVQCV